MLFGERWKAIFRGGGSPATPPLPHSSRYASARETRSIRAAPESSSNVRRSPGLEQFFHMVRDTAGLWMLDLSAASQSNVSFVTNLGHRLYTVDLVRTLDETYPAESFFEAQGNPRLAQQVVDQSLNFPAHQFDGALVWDCLQYMAPALLVTVVDRLYEILRPNAYLLAFFSAEERAVTVPRYLYRIADGRTLLLVPQEHRALSQHFTSRHLERLFGRFQQIKFFLARDSLREVLVKR